MKNRFHKKISGSFGRSSVVLYRFQPIGSDEKALFLELEATTQPNCAGSFAVVISNENALVYDLIPTYYLLLTSNSLLITSNPVTTLFLPIFFA